MLLLRLPLHWLSSSTFVVACAVDEPDHLRCLFRQHLSLKYVKFMHFENILTTAKCKITTVQTGLLPIEFEQTEVKLTSHLDSYEVFSACIRFVVQLSFQMHLYWHKVADL